MGEWAEGQACADPGARSPIGASGNLQVLSVWNQNPIARWHWSHSSTHDLGRGRRSTWPVSGSHEWTTPTCWSSTASPLHWQRKMWRRATQRLPLDFSWREPDLTKNCVAFNFENKFINVYFKIQINAHKSPVEQTKSLYVHTWCYLHTCGAHTLLGSFVLLNIVYTVVQSMYTYTVKPVNLCWPMRAHAR